MADLPGTKINSTEAHSLKSLSTAQENISKEYELLIDLQKALGQKKEAEEIYGVIDNYINNNSNGYNYSYSNKKNLKEVSKIIGLLILEEEIEKKIKQQSHNVYDPEEIKMLEGFKNEVEERIVKTLEKLDGKEDHRKDIEEQLNEMLKKEKAARSSLKTHEEGIIKKNDEGRGL